MLSKWSSALPLLLLLVSNSEATTATRFQNDVIISGNTTAKQALTVTGNETVGGTLGVTGAETVGGACTVTGAGEFGGSLAVGTTSAANSSAVLDLVSTTKGMLPPRMTQTQRDAIATPATGLTIFNTDSSALNIYNGSSWVAAGSGSGGSKNYVMYGDAETNATTGWSLTHSTLDSTTKLPNQTSGSWTSASGSLSFNIDGTNVLSGTKSYEYVSSAVSTAGDMLVSSPLSIDKSDQAHVLQIKMNYQAVSGASNLNFSGTSSNSFGMAIYDYTNNAWIQPAGVWNFVQSSGVGNATATFQVPSNTTSLAVAVYNANASAGSFQIDLDDISLSPVITTLGPSMQDWQVETFTLGAVTTAPTLGGTATEIRRWRQDGDSASYKFETDSTSAGSAGSGIYLWPLHSGQSIDTTKITTYSSVSSLSKATVLGSGFINFKQLSNATSPVIVFAYDANNFMLAAGDGNSADSTAGIEYTPVSSSWNQTSGTGGVTYDFDANAVPIVGWASNTIQSASSGNSGPVAVKANSPTGTPSTSYSTVVYGTVEKDTGGNYNPSTGVFTVPVSGWYTVNSSNLIQATSYATGNENQCKILRSGSDLVIGTAFSVLSGNQNLQCTVRSTDYYTAGQTIQIQANTNASGTLSWVGGSAYNYLSINRVGSNNQVIQASDTVAAKYQSTNAPTVNNTSPTVTFNNKVFDMTTSYSGGSFGCPSPGKYLVTSMMRTTGTAWTAGLGIGIAVAKNGTIDTWLGFNRAWSTTTAALETSGSTTIQCNSGDQLSIKEYSDVSTTLDTSGAFNYITFTRVGN